MPSNSSLAAQAEALLIGKFPLTEAFANNPTVHLTAKALLSLTRKPALFHLNTFFYTTKSQSHKGFFNLHLLTFFCVFCALCG
jgi:hypothetical protein